MTSLRRPSRRQPPNCSKSCAPPSMMRISRSTGWFPTLHTAMSCCAWFGTSLQMVARSVRSKYASSDLQASATVLSPSTRVRIRHRLPRPGLGSEQTEVELHDVLRVIDLNRRRIAIGPVGNEQRCVVPEDLAIVDLIGGLEDRPVVVRGHWRGRSFVVHDIEQDY